MARIRNRLSREEGFTLIELLVVIVVIGILLAIAVPSYLGFRGRAQDSKAQANIRAAVPSMEGFFADNSTYVGATVAALTASYDSGLDQTLTIYNQAVGLYCLKEVGKSGTTWYLKGPGGSITSTQPSGC